MTAAEMIKFCEALPPDTLLLFRDPGDKNEHVRVGPVDGEVVRVGLEEKKWVNFYRVGRGRIPAVLFDFVHKVPGE